MSTLAYLLIFALIASSRGDLCASNGNIPDDQVFVSATPAGGVYAGTYSKIAEATTVVDCFRECCNRPQCNTVFFHDNEVAANRVKCYLIECNRTLLDACAPKQRQGRKFKSTYMINVRSVEETLLHDMLTHAPDEDDEYVTSPRAEDLVTEDQQDEPEARAGDSECNAADDSGCSDNEVCRLTMVGDDFRYLCRCAEGFEPHPVTDVCTEVSRLTEMSTVLPVRPTDRSCEYGVAERCYENEACATHGALRRDGVCVCMRGFSRDERTGWCEADATLPGSSTRTAPSKKASLLRKTTTPLLPTVPKVIPLVVSAGDNKVVQLPTNHVTLTAFVLPKDDVGAKAKQPIDYHYKWELVSHPDGATTGQMVGIVTDTLKLSELTQGLYMFKVVVTADGYFGEGFVNVTVIPVARKNLPPVAVVTPKYQKINQPNDVVIDGSKSTDDDKIVKYHWDQVSGPLDAKKVDDAEMSKAILMLKSVLPGEYKFKLTVTDNDGLENSTFANVTVIKETDYPPKANAGSNVILSLPQREITLYGNASTDDKGIVDYEWIKQSDDKLTADMTGVRTPFLRLQNLEVGDYKFTLKVTDKSGQTSTADIRVFVKAAHNKPPVVNPGKDQVIFLPTSTAVLDGSNSTDDEGISSWAWTQVSGPTSVSIENADRAVASVSSLVQGSYQFKLSLSDEQKLQSSAVVSVVVKPNNNKAPVAMAGGNKILVLPLDLVTLDGSRSTDDREIVSYSWTRSEDSLAWGRVVNRSDHAAKLHLTGLQAGKYSFTLEVKDAEGLTATDVTEILVQPDPHENDLVEIELAADAGSFTHSNLQSLRGELALLLHKQQKDGVTKVLAQDLREDVATGHLIVTFLVTTSASATPSSTTSRVVWPGPEVVEQLRRKFRTSSDVLDFKVVKVDTMVCQTNCSGHGYCSQRSKVCVCEAFWMQNFFRAYFGPKEPNCDWSILYVIIISFVFFVALGAALWSAYCLCKRWRRSRPKKRHRYSLLDDNDDDDDVEVEMLPKESRDNNNYTREGKLQNSSLMVSESDFSTDEEETMFIASRKSNGHLRNGFTKRKSKQRIRT